MGRNGNTYIHNYMNDHVIIKESIPKLEIMEGKRMYPIFKSISRVVSSESTPKKCFPNDIHILLTIKANECTLSKKTRCSKNNLCLR